MHCARDYRTGTAAARASTVSHDPIESAKLLTCDISLAHFRSKPRVIDMPGFPVGCDYEYQHMRLLGMHLQNLSHVAGARPMGKRPYVREAFWVEASIR